ncbi:MAG TPA: ribonuclease, partial [Terracidiphilus sp.]|nr:ribonuclease [Terracidiphilus sp.]
MAKEICISSTPHETRLAILEDDQLAEIYYERENEYTLAGSIYNGRVTRVLPGMQSAFVDVGLERDAFLYVTDFLELEDQEDSEELEKATVSGGVQPPHEVRHSDRGDRPQRGDRPDRGSERSSDRRPREEAPQAEAASADLTDSHFAHSPESNGEATDSTSDEAGAKRWRGRRRRRGGRGQSADAQPEVSAASTGEESAPEEAPRRREPESSHDIRAQAASGRSERTPSFVLPGESLSKYGQTSADEASKATPQAPAPAPRTRSNTSRPSTLIEAPLQWDGSGLLPGESLSRHRNRAPESEPEAAVAEEPVTVEEETFEPQAELESASFHASAEHVKELAEEPEFDDEDEIVEEELSAEEVSEESEAAEAEPDAEASHRVDPNPPSGFRLFGIGGKKKSGDGPEEPAGRQPSQPSSVSTVS